METQDNVQFVHVKKTILLYSIPAVDNATMGLLSRDRSSI